MVRFTYESRNEYKIAYRERDKNKVDKAFPILTFLKKLRAKFAYSEKWLPQKLSQHKVNEHGEPRDMGLSWCDHSDMEVRYSYILFHFIFFYKINMFLWGKSGMQWIQNMSGVKPGIFQESKIIQKQLMIAQNQFKSSIDNIKARR